MAIKVSQLTAEITKALETYTDDVVQEINRAGKQLAATGVQELQQTSPKRTGAYRKGWRVKGDRSPGDITRYVIHNATSYQLTHLLEHGHAKRGGGRVAAKPHIGAVEQRLVDAYVRAAEEAVKSGGG